MTTAADDLWRPWCEARLRALGLIYLTGGSFPVWCSDSPAPWRYPRATTEELLALGFRKQWRGDYTAVLATDGVPLIEYDDGVLCPAWVPDLDDHLGQPGFRHCVNKLTRGTVDLFLTTLALGGRPALRAYLRGLPCPIR